MLLLIFTFACNNQSQQDADQSNNKNEPGLINSEQLSITYATVGEYLQAQKLRIDKMTHDTLAYPKVNGEIRLPVGPSGNTVVTYTDSLTGSDNPDIREYRYLGQFTDIGYYVIEGLLWENSECYLVDKITGSETVMWSRPELSPSGMFLADLSLIYGIEGVQNGIQIWRVGKQADSQQESFSIERYIVIDQDKWVPLGLVWESDSSLLVKAAPADIYLKKNGNPPVEDCYYLRCLIRRE